MAVAKITVVIPCYNTECYIRRCLTALEKQSFRDFEVIVVDDNSSDNSVSLVKDISKDLSITLTVIENEKNLGPAATRNIGINNANSEFITFCDSDDWYDPDFLKIMYDSLHNNAGSKLVFCGYKVVDESGKENLRPLNAANYKNSICEALGLDTDSLCMLMVDTQIMKETLLPELRNGEDMAVVPLLIVKANGCIAVPDMLYNYYRRNDSASQSPSDSVVDSLLLSFEHIKSNFPNEYYNELEYIGVKNILYACLITLFSFSFDISRAKEIIDSFESEFPEWYRNPLIRQLSIYKRVFLKCVNKRFYFGIKIISLLRIVVTRK